METQGFSHSQESTACAISGNENVTDSVFWICTGHQDYCADSWTDGDADLYLPVFSQKAIGSASKIIEHYSPMRKQKMLFVRF